MRGDFNVGARVLSGATAAEVAEGGFVAFEYFAFGEFAEGDAGQRGFGW